MFFKHQSLIKDTQDIYGESYKLICTSAWNVYNILIQYLQFSLLMHIISTNIMLLVTITLHNPYQEVEVWKITLY